MVPQIDITMSMNLRITSGFIVRGKETNSTTVDDGVMV